MKVIIQIPCLNEAETLPLVWEDLPKKIPGVDVIETMIIDDGSSDGTSEVAKKLGVTHIIRHTRPLGLGQSFHDGALKALELGADILVNTDGDNQYPSNRIADLVQPIVKGKADIVVADRQTHTIEHFSPFKKLLQRIGSRVVNLAADTDIPDAASGFRAYSRESLFQLNTITRFSYCMETIIQAGNKHMAITSIPITTNPKTRESRLFKSMRQHVIQSGTAIVRAYIMYRPYMVFGTLGLVLLVLGLVPFARYLYFALMVNEKGHIQSLLFGSTLLTGAFLCLVLNIIADLIRINRILIEDNLTQTKRLRFTKN